MNRDLNIQFGQSRNTEKVNQKINQNKDEQQRKNTVFAGDLNMNQDPIKSRRELAQKKAYQVVSNQQKADNEFTMEVKLYRERLKELEISASNSQEEIASIRNSKKEMMEDYGLTEDSKEHKNIELLKQREKYGMDSLTEEQKKELEKNGPPTEYQKAVMEFDSIIEVHQNLYREASKEMSEVNRKIESLIQAMSFSTAMLDAKEEAANIKKKATEEEISMLVNEAKDHIDETMEEEVEKAEERAEEMETGKAEGTQGLENQEVQDVSSAIQDATGELSKLDKELHVILKENNVLDEDLKGIKVDTTV